MEKHLNELNKLCRLCGDFIEIKAGYRTAKNVSDYQNALKDFYGILPNEEKTVCT